MRKGVKWKREERMEAGGRGGRGGEGRADRCTGRRRIDLVWRIIFRLDHHLIPPPYMETAQVRRLSSTSSVPRARSRASGHPQTKSREPESQPLAPTLNSSLRNLLRLGCRGGGGTSRVRPGPGTYTGTWNESRLLQGVHVCTPPLVTSPHASCNACVHSDYNSRSPRRPNLNAVYV